MGGCICTNKSDTVVKRNNHKDNHVDITKHHRNLSKEVAECMEFKKESSKHKPPRESIINIRNENEDNSKYIHTEGNPRVNLNMQEKRQESNQLPFNNDRQGIDPSVIPEVIRSVIMRHEISGVNEPYMNSRVNPDFNFPEIGNKYSNI